MNEHEENARDAGAKAATDLMKALNSMSYEKEVTEEFIKAITTSHRSLQQCTMRTIFALIMQWADNGEAGNFDLRNEATVEFCQKIKKLALEENAYFPFI